MHLDYWVLLAPLVSVVDGYDEDLMLQGHAHALGRSVTWHIKCHQQESPVHQCAIALVHSQSIALLPGKILCFTHLAILSSDPASKDMRGRTVSMAMAVPEACDKRFPVLLFFGIEISLTAKRSVECGFCSES